MPTLPDRYVVVPYRNVDFTRRAPTHSESKRTVRWVLAVLVSAVGLLGCGGDKRKTEPIYRAPFEPPPALTAREPRVAARRALTIKIDVQDGTCEGSPDSVARRFDHVTVRSTSYAVIVTAYMRPEPKPSPQPDGGYTCAGVGVHFTRIVQLPTPLGDRALVDGGFEDSLSRTGYDPTIRVQARARRLEKLAEDRFGEPW